MTSVEIARSDPRVLYLAMFQTPGIHPRLVRSNDGGATWNAAIDVEPMLGAAGFRIIAIDPTNPDRIYLRVLAGFKNPLAISDDGGQTFRTPIAFDTMSAFVRLSDGPSWSRGSWTARRSPIVRRTRGRRVREQCAASCATQVMLKPWSADVCAAAPAVTPLPPPAPKAGCSVGGERQVMFKGAACLGLLAVLVLGWLRRRSGSI